MRKMMFEERLRERKDSVGGDFDKALQIFIADRKLGLEPLSLFLLFPLST